MPLHGRYPTRFGFEFTPPAMLPIIARLSASHGDDWDKLT